MPCGACAPVAEWRCRDVQRAASFSTAFALERMVARGCSRLKLYANISEQRGLGAWQRCWGSALHSSNSVLNRISWTRTAWTCSFLVPDSRVVWRKALIWVMTLRKSADKKAKRKRAGKRGLRKHTRFTKAGTTTDGIVNAVMRSPECGHEESGAAAEIPSHPSWILGDVTPERTRR